MQAFAHSHLLLRWAASESVPNVSISITRKLMRALRTRLLVFFTSRWSMAEWRVGALGHAQDTSVRAYGA